MGADTSDHGLLVVNHEYTNPELMFPEYLVPNPAAATPPTGSPVPTGEEIPEFLPNPTAENVDVQLEAHGILVVEVLRSDAGRWEVVLDSPYNRRITATTPIPLSWSRRRTRPAQEQAPTAPGRRSSAPSTTARVVSRRGAPSSPARRIFTSTSPTWPSWTKTIPVRALHARLGIPEADSEFLWERFVDRFDVSKEPNEPFRFGWAVEIDPYDAASIPVKRTSLGRFKHEAVNLVMTPEGQVVVYTGDDERFEYVYKFVTAGAYNPDDRAANMDLLDEGTLFVARFAEDGTGEWLPLIYGEGPLDGGEWIRLTGRSAHQCSWRRGSPRRDQDGPPGGYRAQPGQRQGLHGHDQQHGARDSGRR